jgi:hypothetical protein
VEGEHRGVRRTKIPSRTGGRKGAGRRRKRRLNGEYPELENAAMETTQQTAKWTK